jgi:hypothetical protein
METDDTLEFTCSECNSIVGKQDKICSNCGADLTEEFKPAKFSKTRHRIIFYILIAPVIVFLTLFLTTLVGSIYESYSDNYYIYRLDVSLTIMLILFVSSNILFAFLFINQSTKKRIFISLFISAMLLIIYFAINYFKLSSAVLTFSFFVLNELALITFNKINQYKVLAVLVVLMIFSLIKI